MWLLDADLLRLVFFANEDQTPPYSILSHTWPDDELSFQDIMSLRTGTHLLGRTGWSKVQNACRLALSLELRYIWIDTCCIDKSSSAELQEAINSMFRWYELAEICFAYLSDVSASEDPEITGLSFRRSRWFKRDWTLQELIAPTKFSFYDKDLEEIYMRQSIADVIEDITGIRKLFLSDARWRGKIGKTLSTVIVAERMPEDLAYCPKAFQRLQEEIMKKSDDSSLLSWDYEDPYTRWDFEEDSLLAPNPSSFRGYRDLEHSYLEGFNAASFSMNQRGLQMEVPVRVDFTHQLLVYMILGCSSRLEKEYSFEKTEFCLENRSHKSFMAIPLISTSAYSVFEPDSETQKGEHLRLRWCRPILISEEFLGQAQSTSIIIRRPSRQFYKFEHLPISITVPPVPIAQGFTILGIYPPQPTGDNLIFVSLMAGSPQDSPDSTEYIPPLRPGRRQSFPQSMIYSKEHQTMIHIRVQELGTFVVILDYRAVVCRGVRRLTPWECHDINCRVFKTPENCDFEGLQKLSITRVFAHLPEIRSVFQTDPSSIAPQVTVTNRKKGVELVTPPMKSQAYTYYAANGYFHGEAGVNEIHDEGYEFNTDFELRRCKSGMKHSHTLNKRMVLIHILYPHQTV
ncbi:heterokaryon incompatibility protein-domain-containing protein [Fusarium venenatum]|uniref:heterokaryon incompatibility protein-domain-containing protein n=1 Tax=Fusarium venenatum TaxID=56646 RepID=UPI001D35562D|nr:heterokaryon incompatibility protein-domain-containing protein [Fusarium venenatum]